MRITIKTLSEYHIKIFPIQETIHFLTILKVLRKERFLELKQVVGTVEHSLPNDNKINFAKF